MSALQVDFRSRVAKAGEALPGLIEDLMTRSGIPGVAFALLHEGSTIVDGGVGRRSLDDSTASQVDADTVFQLASVSKPIAATVLAALIFRAELAWDSRIADIMPGFDLGDDYVTREVTVGDLLAHRSGLPHAAGDDLEDVGYLWPEILRRIGRLDSHPFRERHAYSNFGFTAAAQAAAHMVGVDWEDLAEREVFAPLRMETASYRSSVFHTHKNRASLHSRIAGQWKAAFERDPDQQAPAGGASASVRDLTQWMKLVLGLGSVDGVTLFDEATLLPALTPQALLGPPANVGSVPAHYGFGFRVSTSAAGRMVYGHSGGFIEGAGTTFRVIPDLDLGIAVLTNAAPIGVAESIASAVQDIVEFGEVTRDWFEFYAPIVASMNAPTGDLVGVTAPVGEAPADVAPYLGTYHDDYFGPAKVIESKPGQLSVALGSDFEYQFTLQPWSSDVFSFVPHGENSPWGSLSSARFGRADGRVNRMQLEYFSSNGRGAWTR